MIDKDGHRQPNQPVQGAGCITAASLAMTRDVVFCRPGDLLHDVWTRMKERGLKNIPVVDQDSQLLGSAITEGNSP